MCLNFEGKTHVEIQANNTEKNLLKVLWRESNSRLSNLAPIVDDEFFSTV